ncbi:MAG: hypothetical protein AAGF12_36045 [Myxococcota bacterium]
MMTGRWCALCSCLVLGFACYSSQTVEETKDANDEGSTESECPRTMPENGARCAAGQEFLECAYPICEGTAESFARCAERGLSGLTWRVRSPMCPDELCREGALCRVEGSSCAPSECGCSYHCVEGRLTLGACPDCD